MRGKKVVFTPFAVGWSDSPTSVLRYIVQQTRWSKSWCREIWYTLGSAWRHGFAGIWLAFECMYQLFYFFLVIYLFARLAVEADPRAQVATVLVSTAIALLKTFYFAFRAKDARAFFFVLYTYVYFFCMIPSRITAMMTLYDVSWGTRGGDEKPTKSARVWLWLKQFGISFLWWAGVIAAGAYSIQKNWYFDWNALEYRFALIGIVSYLGFITIVLMIYFIGKWTRLNYTPLQKSIIEDRILCDAVANIPNV
jgi:hyaluronan synthase